MLDDYIAIKLHHLVNKPKNKNSYPKSVQSKHLISVIYNIIGAINNNYLYICALKIHNNKHEIISI
jgi:hypothetical protein